MRALKNLKNLHFDGLLWTEHIMFELKKYRGVIVLEIGEWCKTWRKLDLWFGKWHKQFGKLSPEHWKTSKFELWWDPFIQCRKCMSLKFTWELCVMTVKNDAKFEEELSIVSSKLTWEIDMSFQDTVFAEFFDEIFYFIIWQKLAKFH